jgi:hypothetical protein
MKLPNADRAVVEIEKLRDYCLSSSHPRGRHKARVFFTTLGIAADNAQELKQAILSAELSKKPCQQNAMNMVNVLLLIFR